MIAGTITIAEALTTDIAEGDNLRLQLQEQERSCASGDIHTTVQLV